MATQEGFETVLDRIDTATTEIATDLRDLREQVKGAGLSAELEESILARLEAHATRLEGIAADPEDPVPGDPPPDPPTE